MFFPSAENTITYRLSGESLKTASEIHELSKQVNQEYREIEQNVREYSQDLMATFNGAHTYKFTELLGKLAAQLGIPSQDITMFHLDASYLDDHGVAFLKQSTGHIPPPCPIHGDQEELPGEDGG
jgi:hypothetical protein